MIKLADGVVKVLPTTQETDLKITPQQLENAISKKPKLKLKGLSYNYKEN